MAGRKAVSQGCDDRLSCPLDACRSQVRPAAAIRPGRITEAEGTRLAKKPNYDFEKRRKELERKQKKDAKRDERLQRRRSGGAEDGDLAADDGTVAADSDDAPAES